MENSSHLLIAIVILFTTAIVGFSCRYLPQKWSLPAAALSGGSVGLMISVLARQGRVSMSIPSGFESGQTFNSTFNIAMGLEASFSIVYLTLLGGVCASMMASESFRKRVWKLQFGEHGWKGPQTAADKAKYKSRSEKAQRKNLPLYLCFGLACLIFSGIFTTGILTTWNHKKVEGIVSEISHNKALASGPKLLKKVPVTIQYTVAGVSHQFKEYYSEHAVPKLNSKVAVMYDPCNSAKGEIDHTVAHIVIVLGCTLCGVWMIWWTIKTWKEPLPA